MKGAVRRRRKPGQTSARVHAVAPALVALALSLACGCATERGTIGAVLAQTPDRRLVVRDAPVGLAAAREGLTAGDQVLLIDGRDVRRLSAEQVHLALAGDIGDPVKLTIIRGERVLRVTLHRTPARRLPTRGAAGPEFPQ